MSALCGRERSRFRGHHRRRQMRGLFLQVASVNSKGSSSVHVSRLFSAFDCPVNHVTSADRSLLSPTSCQPMRQLPRFGNAQASTAPAMDERCEIPSVNSVATACPHLPAEPDRERSTIRGTKIPRSGPRIHTGWFDTILDDSIARSPSVFARTSQGGAVPAQANGQNQPRHAGPVLYETPPPAPRRLFLTAALPSRAVGRCCNRA
jgi:hypothetical protein